MNLLKIIIRRGIAAHGFATGFPKDWIDSTIIAVLKVQT